MSRDKPFLIGVSQSADLSDLHLNPDASLLDSLALRDFRVKSWKDVAELVGAKREDFDRIRHAARWQQENLPGMKAAGKF